MANPALDRMFAYAPRERLNQCLERLLPGDRRLHGMHKDDSTIPVQVSLAGLVEEGRSYAQATVIDASGRG